MKRFPHVSPNSITLVRFVLSIALFFPVPELAALTVVLVGVAGDILDGTLARGRNQVTFIGKIFDPFADKFLGAAAGWYLLSRGLVGLPVITVIVIYELLVLLLVWLIAIKKGPDIRPDVFGRFGGFIYAIGVVALLLGVQEYLVLQAVLAGLALRMLSTIARSLRSSSHNLVEDNSTRLLRAKFYSWIARRVAPMIVVFAGVPAAMNIAAHLFLAAQPLADVWTLLIWIALAGLWTASLLYFWLIGLPELTTAFREALGETDSQKLVGRTYRSWHSRRESISLINQEFE